MTLAITELRYGKGTPDDNPFELIEPASEAQDDQVHVIRKEELLRATAA